MTFLPHKDLELTRLLQATIKEKQAVIDELVKGYMEAVEDIEDWSSYASNYFIAKYNLLETVEKHKKLINKYRKL